MAPRRPFWAMSPVTRENRSIKDTAPLEALAALLTLAPSGAKALMSMPQPPP